MAKKYIVANSLQPTDRLKVTEYIQGIRNYEACLGAATLALRMLWELVFAYQDVTPAGEPTNKSVRSNDDKADTQFIRKENTSDFEFDIYRKIAECCHYQEKHDSLTNEGRKKRFEYLAAKSKEAILTRFEKYTTNKVGEDINLYEALGIMFSMFETRNNNSDDPELYSEGYYTDDKEYARLYLDRICKEYRPRDQAYYSDVFYIRYISEMIIHKTARKINPNLRRTNYKDFVEVLKKANSNINVPENEQAVKVDMGNLADVIGEIIHPRFHWFYTENDQNNQYSQNDLIPPARTHLSDLLTRYITDDSDMENVGELINCLNESRQPVDKRVENYLLDRINEKEQLCTESKSIVEQMKKKKKKAHRANIIIIIFLVVVVVGRELWAYFTFLPHSGDPNPRIRETIDSAASWLETPSVSVYIAGTEAEQNEALVLYANGEPTLIQVDAVCNGEYSLKYSQSERLANRYDYAVNPFGLSKLQYQLYSLGYDETTDMSMGRYSLSVGSGSASFNPELLPGWYCLSVQAVGAGDGITQNDNELVASTGWINYYILVLPADENPEWTLHNRSTNSYAATKDGLSIQEGQSLVVNCDAIIQEGLELYYAWDSDSWEKVESDTEIKVPPMEAGLHTLNLRACYVYNEDIVVETFTNSFSCMFEAPTLPECNVELTVLSPDGNVIQDGSTIIVQPEDKISISAYGRYGISRVEWYGTYEDEKVTEVHSKGPDFTITLKGEYGSGSRSLYITAIGVGDGGIEDQLNRKQISLNLLFRTCEDEYDADGNLVKEWIYDDATSNEPTGYMLYSKEYEEDATVETWAWYSADGEPAYCKDEGYHSWITIRTSSGYESWVFDLDETTPIENTNAFGEDANGAAGIKVQYYENKYSCYYYGADRELYSGLRGNVGYEQVEDEYGNILEDRVYGTDRAPILNTNGWHIYKSKYDENGNEIEACFLDVEGNPCDWTGGYHRFVRTYDDYGNQISEITYHADGSAIVKDGYTKWVKVFLSGTNIEESCEYRDENDVPVINSALGYSRVERTYSNGVLELESYYDEKNSLINCQEGYASIEYINEPLYKATLYKDTTGTLVIPNDQHWAKCEKFYDVDGNLTDVFYYSDASTLTGCDGTRTPAHFVYNYNDEGKMIEEYCYDVNGKALPMLENVNYCGKSYIYDTTDDSVYYVYYLDENENPNTNETGFFMARITEDNSGNIVREERFLQDGSMPTGDTIRRIEWTFNGTKTTSEIEYTEPRTDVISQTVRVYDNDGDLSSVAYYDGNGAPVEDEYGIHKYTYIWTFDEGAEMTILRAECLDDKGNLKIGSDGYAAVEIKYSWEEEPVHILICESFWVGEWWFGSESYLEVHYIGTNGKDMVNVKAGYAAYCKESSNTQSVESFYDQSGNLLYVEKLGYAKLIRSYENGEMIQWAFYGADDQLCLNHYGFAMEKWDYDENGYQISHSFHNTDESLMLNEYGTYALNESQYENGNRIYNAFKDADGKLMLNPDYGYAICRKEWSGADFETKYYDEHDGLIQSEDVTLDHNYPTDSIN